MHKSHLLTAAAQRCAGIFHYLVAVFNV